MNEARRFRQILVSRLLSFPGYGRYALIALMALVSFLINAAGDERQVFRLFIPGSIGGPDSRNNFVAESQAAGVSDDQLVLNSREALGGDIGVPEEFSGYFFVFEDSVAGWSNPIPGSLTWVPKRDEIMTYEVEEGDSAATIAAKFGISLNTLSWANDLRDGAEVQPGQKLVILPVSGVVHTVRPGDTLASIAGYYNVSSVKIAAMNKIIGPNGLTPGQKLVIPDGQPPGVRAETALGQGALRRSLVGTFRAPTTGWNWGRLHRNNAVDIADACGTPVYAAAAGFVTLAESKDNSDGWNQGYGYNIEIKHADATETRYAHLSAILVSSGAYVNQGDLIGTIGNTGQTDGPTGCHLHFEVHGAPNPFVRY